MPAMPMPFHLMAVAYHIAELFWDPPTRRFTQIQSAQPSQPSQHVSVHANNSTAPLRPTLSFHQGTQS
jgi:type II secretory pathway component PulM